MGKLDGKVALVTGASKGIGAGIALSLAKEGAAVAVNYASDREGADRVVEKIKAAGGKSIAVQGSVTGVNGEIKISGDDGLGLAWQSRVMLWKRTAEVFVPTVTVWGMAQHLLFTSHSRRLAFLADRPLSIPPARSHS